MNQFFLLTLFILFTTTACSHHLYAQHTVSAPLFEEDDQISLTLQTDMKELLADRGEDPDQHAAQIIYNENGEEIVHDIKVRVRGNFRRQERNCSFPPLRLNFVKKEVQGTLFDNQDKLKLVNPCQRGQKEYEQYILLEYLVYRIYNVLTPYSFRVRLVRMRFEDEAGRIGDLESYGFLIEDEDQLAKRLSASILDIEHLHQEATDRQQMTLLALFQYMIGNTDWSVPDLHNIRLLDVPDKSLPVPVPYDFDFSGMVETPYAIPRPDLPVQSVSDRYYLGYCRSEKELDKAIALISDQREAINALFDEVQPLNRKMARVAQRFLDAFFNLIESPRKAHRTLDRACFEEN